MPPKKPDKPDEEPDEPDEEPDDYQETQRDLEVVEEIQTVKLTKSGRPRKQMSDEVKARNTANLVLARAKAVALKKAHASLTDKEKAIEKEKKDAKKKAKEDLIAAQDDTITAYEHEKREKKIKDLKEEVKPKAVKKKKKTIIIEESDTEDEDDGEEEMVVKRVRKKKPTPPPPAPPAPPPAAPLDIVTPVVPVPVPKVYTDEEVAKLKSQKIMFEKEQKKRAILMNAIFN